MDNSILDPLAPTIDPADLRVDSFEVRGAVFVLPSDAPIPSELSDAPLPTGTLYDRIQPLNVEKHESFAFVPVSGAELIALDRVWRTLARPARIYVLMDIPGARYDVLFTQATRQLGLSTIAWPDVAQALGERTRFLQRTADTSSWDIKKDLPAARRRQDSTNRIDSSPLAVPESIDDEN